MIIELTAVYETGENGIIHATVAEIPGIVTQAGTIEEARATLEERLRTHLRAEHEATMSRASAAAQIERLRIETKNGPVRKEQINRPRPATSDLLRCLLEQGLIDKIPPPEALGDNFQPIRIAGKPISQQLLEERR